VKILFLARSLGVGGSERQIALLAAGLARRGHDVAVATLYGGGTMERMLNDTQVRSISLGKVARWHLSGPLWRLWRLFLAERPDVVYAFLPTQTVLAGLLLPPWLPTRLVFGLRASNTDLSRYDILTGISYGMERWVARRADLQIANAVAVRAHAIGRGIPAARIVVVPNGIDTEALRPDSEAGASLRRTWGIAERDFLIGLVARLDPVKDHTNFIMAAARFAQTCHDAHFVCVGEGPEPLRRHLVELVAAEGLSSRLIWAGEHHDMRAVYNALDIATLTSAFGEGFPNVVGEAMACGVPVVTTDVGDARLMIGDVGEVVPARRPDLLAEAWSQMRRRLTEDGARIRTAARRIVEQRFSIEAMISRTEGALAATCVDGPTKRSEGDVI